ncbi:hypothetical protein HBI56_116250 [Parastagonospora nodorum]|uniref:Uncharacterized protein n=2 Tax=Phaeosphaeria nodorum (strain SN15 / ATCC MYA-4574 / FGSC 10173) TaxID=321614 RepID=Q0UG92_PHANO|nr:hypothetical protein SNOG_09222 [Parastagonospora nodorum SN15]KAH3904152.1 hypothetical protein HBH56_238340 [Parastagonospora nodorum]EAT83414.1 hypothetical protein SNOG_09222 [Parastagonospora nodorum SN15]KAH3925894.1 hypothetical protein HBH54_177130 [Parastagonospora nodorum]KAH3976600.1 hypothetical protein HBH52_120140 [Parastagonospora nodorum]KAH3984398.1 hypothetical protein HBH51_028640 [Parastagonospora nodorum]
MFPTPSMWLPEAFRHFQTPTSPFPLHNYTSPAPMDPYPGSPPYKPTRRSSKTPYKHISHFPADASDTEIDSDTDATHAPDFEHFPRISVRMPKHTAHSLRADQILILPPTLTALKICLHSQGPKRTIRAAVAGDMRLRDVVKQVLPQEYLRDARVHVKSRGEWLEPGSPMKVSDIAEMGRFARNERGEVEVRIAVENDRRERREYMWERREEGHGWEKGVGGRRMERMMY